MTPEAAARLVLPLAAGDSAGANARSTGDDALALLGGKGASLVRLVAAGVPVPDGFVITTDAFRAVLAADGLDRNVAAILAHRPPDRAAARIRELFLEARLPAAVETAVTTAYRELGRPRVAVRSSATAEDLPGLSFAGQQDTLLNVTGASALLDAVRRCWASLWSARAVGYRAEHQVADDDLALAVVVQRMVDAEAAGVLFTADPVTGDGSMITVESAWGLGEAVVSGIVTPDRFRIAADDHRVLESTVAEKTVMTVRTRGGTTERPVPAARRTRPSLEPAQARRLAALGARVAELDGHPVDIEWARVGDELAVLQARPITAGARPDPWNDSRAVSCLWTRGNVGEAIPDVMTPATWCLVREFLADAMPTSSVPPYVAFGIVGGRLYLNLSMAASIARCAGVGERLFRRLTHEVFGRLPDDLPIPYLPLPPTRVIRLVVPVALSMTVHARRDIRRLPDYLADHPAHCRRLRERIAAVDDPTELARLWTEVIHPEFHAATGMLTAATRSDGPVLVTLRRSLQRAVGLEDTERLLAGLGGTDGELASLGPLVGLERLADGDLDVEGFRDRYGHRGPHEFEISVPRPAEDPAWIERTVAEQRAADYSVSELLRRQERARADAWARFSREHPHRVASVRNKIEKWTQISRRREEARSEVVRFFWVLRAFWVRAGELSGIGDDVFAHDWNEVVALLGGRPLQERELRDRQRAFRAYSALPAYPSVIMGRFDPFAWAADPDRPLAVFVEGADHDRDHGRSAGADHGAGGSATVTGFAGSGGVVEGVVRVLESTDQSAELESGEVLVTNVTNVGWTPLFPRVRAVITDVGAPLSHAAIVARELGIPAVVGCGDATRVLRTGDRVRVDGTHGTVELLDRVG
ncbi:pyruvate,water dikinase [Friedmanniella endophytica]|uniref:Pyruvate,water dikinase n=1 Tax=Microlunatus kandeliicorticis TaxID=1759536 RepID=A0A7W3P536_9ACTN|nr:PEP/pyruvate-binding domain-containing protein [Microlunatus kandeliicorticis]MBA8793470.1 pyruvate,water dikinase [Microlunatus kandeliicorticis]